MSGGEAAARQLAAIVLGCQALVVALATPVLISVGELNKPLALTWGLGAAGLCLIAAGLLRRRLGYLLGWLVQPATLAMGFVTPTMFVLGALFAGLWVLALRLGRKADAAGSAQPR